MSGSVRELLDAFLMEARPGAASIEQRIDASHNEYFVVCPQNPRSAKIRVLAEVDIEYSLDIGRGTLVEVPLESGRGYSSGEEEFLAICKAVARGEFVERVSSVLGKNLFVYGRINLNGRALRSFSGLPLVPCWRTLRYEPY
jgi:hypothetical protein